MPVPAAVTLEAPGASATIAPDAGGRLASLRVGERELLVGRPAPDDRTIHWGSFLMAPWPGRLGDGRLEWGGRTLQLPRTHGRHAIHGLVWSRPCDVEASARGAATLASELPRDAWPMGGTVRQTYRLAAGALVCEAEITAAEPMPVALGWHPWFQRGIPDPSLRLRATGVLERRRMLPTGATLPLAGKRDLRSGPVLGRRRLDDAYAGVESPAILRWPDLELAVEFGDDCRFATVYTPWNAVCVEPQTAAPDALALPRAAAERAGIRFLEAGETLRSAMTLRWRRPEAGAGPGA